MKGWRGFAAAWQAFWFTPSSPLPLAVFRILFGLLVLANGILMAPDWLVWFGERGIVTPETAHGLLAAGPRPDVFGWLPAGDGWTYLVLGAYLTAALGLTFGFYTRTSAVVLLVCFLSMHNRDPLILNSPDKLMRIITFILIFSPAGAALSLDRRLRAARGEVQGDPARVSPWTLRLLQVQLATVYLDAALIKSGGTTWLDGTALHYALRVDTFARFPIPYVPDHLWAINALTWGTLALEFALGTLVWLRPLRYPVLLGGLLFHAGIGWAMTVPLFGLLMAIMYVVFVDAADLARVLTKAKTTARWLPPLRTRRIV